MNFDLSSFSRILARRTLHSQGDRSSRWHVDYTFCDRWRVWGETRRHCPEVGKGRSPDFMYYDPYTKFRWLSTRIRLVFSYVIQVLSLYVRVCSVIRVVSDTPENLEYHPFTRSGFRVRIHRYTPDFLTYCRKGLW